MYLIDSSELHVNYMAIFVHTPPPKKKDTEDIVLNKIILYHTTVKVQQKINFF